MMQVTHWRKKKLNLKLQVFHVVSKYIFPKYCTLSAYPSYCWKNIALNVPKNFCGICFFQSIKQPLKLRK